ncbi:MAG: hypothetical protein AAFV19_11715 [Pseudomonadota bacterium]
MTVPQPLSWVGPESGARAVTERLDLAANALPMGGNWYPEEPVLGLLIDQIESLNTPRIVCCGAGLGAVIAARTVAQQGTGQVWVIEDDPLALAVTSDLLAEAGCRDDAVLIEAELADYGKGLWYAGHALGRLPTQFDLLFIDGPGHFAGPFPRWPAGPELFHRMGEGGVVILDDARRVKEKKALKRWGEAYPWLRRDRKADRGGAAVLRVDHSGWS